MIEDFISEKYSNSEEMAELNGLIVKQLARIEMLKSGLRQVSSYTEILERCIEDKEEGIKIMIKELTVIVNELYRSRADIMGMKTPETDYDSGVISAYTHAIQLINDLLDKHEGVKDEKE